MSWSFEVNGNYETFSWWILRRAPRCFFQHFWLLLLSSITLRNVIRSQISSVFNSVWSCFSFILLGLNWSYKQILKPKSILWRKRSSCINDSLYTGWSYDIKLVTLRFSSFSSLVYELLFNISLDLRNSFNSLASSNYRTFLYIKIILRQ